MGRSRTARLRAHWRGYPAIAALLMLTSAVSGCGVLSGLGTHKLQTPATMTLTSSAFIQGGLIPQRFTCYGAGFSPPLYWTGAPPGTKSFAIAVDDSDAPILPYVYWLVYNIPAPATTSIAQNTLPPGAWQGLNSRGTKRYDPPCPARAKHAYRLTVMALNARVSLPDGSSIHDLWPEITSHVIGVGRLTALAEPPGRHA